MIPGAMFWPRLVRRPTCSCSVGGSGIIGIWIWRLTPFAYGSMMRAAGDFTRGTHSIFIWMGCTLMHLVGRTNTSIPVAWHMRTNGLGAWELQWMSALSMQWDQDRRCQTRSSADLIGEAGHGVLDILMFGTNLSSCNVRFAIGNCGGPPGVSWTCGGK